MNKTLSIEQVEHELHHVLEQMHIGETVTIVDTDASPIAVLISLRQGDVVPVKTNGRSIRQMLEQFRVGDMDTLYGTNGSRQALLVSTQTKQKGKLSPEEWLACLDDLNERFSQLPPSDESLVDILSEMRR